MAVVVATLADGLQVSSVDSLYSASAYTLADLFIVSSAPAQTGTLSATITEALSLVALPEAGSILAVALRVGIAIGVSARMGFSASLRSGLTVAARALVHQGVTLSEGLRVRPAAAVVATLHRAMADRFTLADFLPRSGIAGFLASAFEIASTALGLRRIPAAQADTLELSDVLARTLTVTVVSRESVLIHDATLLLSIFAGTLADAVDFIIDTASPAGDVTTWAMNVRTGAVTEYLNYGFNSFARSANGTYLGAGDDGLFELVGPDDAGVPVVADIISGLVDFGGSFLSGMQAAYLAVRGGGEFFLKLTSGTGRSTTYQVKATSLRTARVNMGKGLRARYFTYELISVGQDFDLLDLTFLPIQQTRRI